MGRVILISAAINKPALAKTCLRAWCGAGCHFQPGWATLEETHGCALAFMAGAGMH